MTGPTRRTVRVGAGIAVAALFAAAIPAAALAPWPAAVREPVAVTALPEPTASLVSCAGPILAVGRDATDAALLTDAAGQDVAAATAPGQPDAAAARLASPDVSGGAGPDALSAEPREGTRTDLAAAGSATVADEDLAGFAASACAPGLMESWLVGGSGATGAADLLLLSNPSGVASEVDITVYGAEGAVQPAAAAGIIVPARTQRVLPLAALALGQESPVVRVNAAGAPIQASLQTSLTRTLLPGGVDQVGTTAAPDTVQVIPSATVVVAPGEEGASEPGARLRLLAPSDDTDVVVDLTPLGSGAAASETLELSAGVPAELELGGLAAGTYRVEVTAEHPVVTALWTTSGFGEGTDFAWHTAPSVISVPSLVAVAVGPSPFLALSNEGEEESRVTLSGPAGESDIVVPAGGAVRTRVQDAAVYQLTPQGGAIRANVTYRGSGALAGYDVIPADAAAEPVVVFPQ
ncbi:DUF5719 family protein [Microbacterium sp. PA5]|uniref:DUF5719 family protein n=1 Tax=Microbacterium sp. PA5 TaxID=3416654 RepID=UPI003CF8FE3F